MIPFNPYIVGVEFGEGVASLTWRAKRRKIDQRGSSGELCERCEKQQRRKGYRFCRLCCRPALRAMPHYKAPESIPTISGHGLAACYDVPSPAYPIAERPDAVVLCVAEAYRPRRGWHGPRRQDPPEPNATQYRVASPSIAADEVKPGKKDPDRDRFHRRRCKAVGDNGECDQRLPSIDFVEGAQRARWVTRPKRDGSLPIAACAACHANVLHEILCRDSVLRELVFPAGGARTRAEMIVAPCDFLVSNRRELVSPTKAAELMIGSEPGQRETATPYRWKGQANRMLRLKGGVREYPLLVSEEIRDEVNECRRLVEIGRGDDWTPKNAEDRATRQTVRGHGSPDTAEPKILKSAVSLRKSA